MTRENLTDLGELEIASGANQIGNLKRAGETRWRSHYDYVCNLLMLYKPTYLVLKDIANTKGQRKAAGVVALIIIFDFVFILHVTKELMGITDMLCKKLQHKPQDIVNAMDDVATKNN